MKLVWSPEALQDLIEIRTYIAKDAPDAATSVVKRIVTLVSTQLPANPQSGRTGRVAGTRELVVTGTPFIVPYRVGSETLEILRVYHATRRWPNQL